MLLMLTLLDAYKPNVFRREEGQALVEYGLILTMVAILLVVSLFLFRDAVTTAYANIVTEIADAT